MTRIVCCLVLMVGFCSLGFAHDVLQKKNSVIVQLTVTNPPQSQSSNRMIAHEISRTKQKSKVKHKDMRSGQGGIEMFLYDSPQSMTLAATQ
jgi:hypothetical protein